MTRDELRVGLGPIAADGSHEVLVTAGSATLVPHVCMTCGDCRSVLGGGTPYCMNHGPAGLPMCPWPLERLREAIT